ncbi:MAG: cbb3-type cytochrome c oxidase subunit II [Verrucomicrobiales bacterium]
MKELQKFTIGLALAFGLPWLCLIVIPWAKMGSLAAVGYSEADEQPPGAVFPAGPAGRVANGREVYAAEGCTYCHTQMVRPTYAGADLWRPGWGGREEEGLERSTRPEDFLGEPYAFLGVHRVGPDLANVGWRLDDEAWHHLHLYDPRAVTPWSIMPSYSYLYRLQKIESAPSEDALDLPAELAPPDGFEVVPTPEARVLVDYLRSLKKDSKIPVALTGGAAQGSEG